MSGDGPFLPTTFALLSLPGSWSLSPHSVPPQYIGSQVVACRVPTQAPGLAVLPAAVSDLWGRPAGYQNVLIHFESIGKHKVRTQLLGDMRGSWDSVWEKGRPQEPSYHGPWGSWAALVSVLRPCPFQPVSTHGHLWALCCPPSNTVDMRTEWVWLLPQALEKKGISHLEEKELKERNKRIQEDNRLELQKVKQLRLEREREKAMREQELELLQREKEAEHFKTWEEQEDSFHLRQAKLRCALAGFCCRPCPFSPGSAGWDVYSRDRPSAVC